MKKRLVADTMLIVVLALLISTVAGALGLFVRQMGASGGSLRELLAFMDAQEETTQADNLAEAFSAAMPESRLTVIAADGTVLKDTGSDTDENHLERPEIQDAMENGWGEAARRSATLDYPMLYVAKRFSDGVIVRAATPMSTVDSLIWNGIPPLIAAAMAALALAWALSRRSVRRLARPLISIDLALQEAIHGRDCDALEPYEEDDELRPILRSIGFLAARVRDSIASAVEERNKIALILDCMNEGLILLDDAGGVLAVNRSARERFGLPEGGGSARVFLRSKKVRGAVDAARRENAPAVLDLRDEALGDRDLRFYVSPVSGREYEGQKVGSAVLITDVTELKKAERAREQFTANVSHELKTPLTSIRGFTEMLEQGMVASEEDRRRFISMIGVETDRLIALINDILELSELDGAAIEQPAESAGPLKTAMEAAELLAPRAAERGVEIAVSGSERAAAIAPGRLKELLMNLMENAVKYSGEDGGHVSVSVLPGDGTVTVRVRDDGIGIPAGALPHIFERFYRVDRSRSKATGGTGLGLAIVKHICLLYGGSVGVESVPGAGSTFTVVLPAARSGRNAGELEPAR